MTLHAFIDSRMFNSHFWYYEYLKITSHETSLTILNSWSRCRLNHKAQTLDLKRVIRIALFSMKTSFSHFSFSHLYFVYSWFIFFSFSCSFSFVFRLKQFKHLYLIESIKRTVWFFTWCITSGEKKKWNKQKHRPHVADVRFGT